MRSDPKKGIYLIAALVFFGIVILYALELRVINRYLDANRLIRISLIFGALAGIFPAWLIIRRQKELYEKVRLGVGIWAATLIFSPLLVSLTNRLTAFGPPENIPAVMAAHEARFTSRFGASSKASMAANQHIYFFYLGSKLRRITVAEPIWENSESGDTVSLAVKKGGLGLNWIYLPAR